MRIILAALAAVVTFFLVVAVAISAGLLVPVAAMLAVLAAVLVVGLIVHAPHRVDRRQPPGFR